MIRPPNYRSLLLAATHMLFIRVHNIGYLKPQSLDDTFNLEERGSQRRPDQVTAIAKLWFASQTLKKEK